MRRVEGAALSEDRKDEFVPSVPEAGLGGR